MSDICKAIFHIMLGVLFALLAGAEKTEMFWVVWFALSSLVNFWAKLSISSGSERDLRSNNTAV